MQHPQEVGALTLAEEPFDMAKMQEGLMISLYASMSAMIDAPM